MKLNKIRIHNINSLRGDFEIDFSKEPFVSSTLFAITGPTGSGKSTILDAISLALFNRIPRINSAISKNILSKGGFLLTRNEKECYVEVEYSCAAGDFRSKWSTRLTRNFTQDDYDMELIDLSTNKPVDVRRSDIPSKNESLIGLNYDQFLRAILLAQGAFSAFLDANANDRAKLLEDISGTGIYRKLGARAYEEFHSRNKEINDKLSTIQTLRNEQMSEDDFISSENELRTVEEQLISLRDRQSKLKSLRDVKIRIQNYTKDLYAIDQSFIQLNNKQEQFNTSLKPRLDKHRKLSGLSEEIINYTRDNNELKEVKQAIVEFTEQLNNSRLLFDQSIKAISDYIKKDVDEHTAPVQLNAYREDVIQLQSAYRSAQEKFESAEKQVIQYIRHASLKKYSFAYPSDQLHDDVLSALKELSAKVSSGEIREKLAPGVEKVNQKFQALLELKGLVGQFLQLNKRLGTKQDQLKELQQKIIDDDTIQKLVSSVRDEEQQLKSMNDHILRLIREATGAKQIREQLKPGEPCPVCGSLEHPYAGEYIDRLQEEERKLQMFRDQLETKKDYLQEQKQLQQQVNDRLKEIGNEIESGKKEILTLNENIARLKKIAELDRIEKSSVVDNALEQARSEMSNLQEQLENYNTIDALNILSQSLRELSEITVSRNHAKDSLQRIYTGKNINQECDALLHAFNRSHAALQSIESRLDDKNSQQLQLSQNIYKREQILLPQLQQIGYKDIAEAFAAILSASDFQRFSKEEALLQQERASLLSRKEQVELQLERESKDDDGSLNISACEEQLQEIVHILQENEERKKVLVGKISAQKNRTEMIGRLQMEVGAKEQEVLPWRLLNNLIGDRTGNRFNGFAQELTMSKLIKLTNVHLGHFNDRYILSMPNKNEDEDLVIIDGYMGNERRSVKTLSGGEKFMVSLSLALSMSDLASREVSIQSLFIDEGISTLDPETLDQVVSTLEQLQFNSQKTIGVISHVEALKDRIQTQVQLEKMPTGFSSMSIVPEAVE